VKRFEQEPEEPLALGARPGLAFGESTHR
jgi:hypothetical protein